MAEKEERISVIVYEKDPCKNCPGNPMTDCQVCEKDLRYDGGMKRQEAIERIEKALSLVQAKTFVDEIQWERVMNGCRYEAEAALNALLEGNEKL